MPVLSRDDEVRVLDYAPGRSHYDVREAGAVLINGDIREPAEVARAVKGCDTVEVFHLSSGHETSVLELPKLLNDIAGKPNHPIEFRGWRRGEVSRNFAFYAKARRGLGFEPRWRLRDGPVATWDWFVGQGDVAPTAEAS